MAGDFDKILDECIDRLNRGDSLQECLVDYPEFAQQLEPLLQAVAQTKGVYSFEPSTQTKAVARQRFNVAFDRLQQGDGRRQALFTRLFGRPLVWVSLATAIVILVVGYFGILHFIYPVEPVVPSPEGNFVFLISDDVNAIGDFESLNVVISEIGILASEDSGQWVEFEPEIGGVDLTLVQGDKTQEIWRGNIPQGRYNNVFIYVTEVKGILKETGETVEIKLPSQKLHMTKSFQVTVDTVTSFTYDLTVVATGSSQSGIKYILKPQIGQSGANYKPHDDKGNNK